MFVTASVYLKYTNTVVPDMRGSAARTNNMHIIAHVTGELVEWDPNWLPVRDIVRVWLLSNVHYLFVSDYSTARN